jgi:sodium-dependent dicarboxylate transporter 2/3/5
MASLLFIIPGDRNADGTRPALMNWEAAERGIPWGMLLLFGGGFAMADAFGSTGLSEWLGGRFASTVAGQPVWVLVLGVSLLLTFLTEFTSNTATINTLLPTLAAMSVQLEIDPRLLLIPATISASCAFMLPVATPPNAIVFSTGRIPMSSMVRYGIVLNLAGAFWITLWTYYVARPVMQIPLPGISP